MAVRWVAVRPAVVCLVTVVAEAVAGGTSLQAVYRQGVLPGLLQCSFTAAAAPVGPRAPLPWARKGRLQPQQLAGVAPQVPRVSLRLRWSFTFPAELKGWLKVSPRLQATKRYHIALLTIGAGEL